MGHILPRKTRYSPVVQKMARSVEQGDPKVTSIPTQTKLPRIAREDLDIERANSDILIFLMMYLISKYKNLFLIIMILKWGL